MKNSERAAIALALLPAMTGCMSEFHQHHYFRTVDAGGHSLNYYKVSVDGGVFLSSSRYLAGYFDEKAVDTYFNELSQPDNGQLMPVSNASAGTPASQNSNGSSVGLAPIDSSIQNGALVLLLSSNSDEIATSISALTQSNDINSDLTAMVSSDRNQKNQKAAVSQKNSVAAGNALRTLGDSTIETLVPASTPAADVPTNLLTYANALASFLEPVRTFTSLDEAKTWIDQNSARLAKENP